MEEGVDDVLLAQLLERGEQAGEEGVVVLLVDGVGVELLLQVVADGGVLGALEVQGASALGVVRLDGVGPVSASEQGSSL